MAADTLTRLRSLSRQAGMPVGSGKAPPADDTLSRLRALQRSRRGAVDRHADTDPHAEASTEAQLAERLAGEVVADGLIRLCSRHPLPAHWSSERLGLPGQPVSSPEGLVFLDTETTGLAGGSGTLAFLVGVVRVRDHGLELVQYLITRYAAEHTLLRALRSEIGAHAHAWVTYNGKSYDLPLLETRSRLLGQGAWATLTDHLDLVHAVRRGFADRWPDCRLVTAESRLLGVRRHDDLPGAEAPEAWFRYLRHRDAGRLVRVVDHNRQDLLSLTALLPVLHAMYEDPLSIEANPLGVARAVYAAGGSPEAALDILEQGRAELDREGLLELARWARRHGNLELAVEVWEELAAAGDQQAIESLAKYLEHERRDFVRALEVARRLQPMHHHRPRLARLEAKLQRQQRR